MQASKGLRRRSAPERSASRKTHCRKSVARRSQRRKSAPEKSQSINSFQQMRESDRSVSLKLTLSKLDRPKNIRGKVKCERSEPCQPVRKKMILTGASSSKLACRGAMRGAPSAGGGRSAPLASRKGQVSSRDFLNRVAPSDNFHHTYTRGGRHPRMVPERVPLKSRERSSHTSCKRPPLAAPRRRGSQSPQYPGVVERSMHPAIRVPGTLNVTERNSDVVL